MVLKNFYVEHLKYVGMIKIIYRGRNVYGKRQNFLVIFLPLQLCNFTHKMIVKFCSGFYEPIVMQKIVGNIKARIVCVKVVRKMPSRTKSLLQKSLMQHWKC